MIKPRYEYKEKAKSLMEGKYGEVIIITIIFSVIAGVITSASSNYGAQYDVTTLQLIDSGNPMLSNLFNLLAFLFSAGVTYGTAKMYIGVTLNQRPDAGTIVLSGFKENFIRNIALLFLQTLYTSLWTLLFIIPGIVKSYAYSMSHYLVIHEPELSSSDAITKSKQVTQGHKSALFMLDLSYFGWYFLGLFTFGILWLFIAPKHQTARILMFDDIYGFVKPAEVVEPVKKGDIDILNS